MPLETATYLDELVATNPIGTEGQDKGDNHIRLIKSVLKNTFPGLTEAVTLGDWAGKTSTYGALTADATQDAADDGKLVYFDTSVAAALVTYDLVAAETAGVGFFQVIKKSDDRYPLGLQASSGETLNGESLYYMGPGETLILFCTGVSWMAVHSIDAMPGTIQAQALAVPGLGWQDCDGSELNRETYVRLFNKITLNRTGARTSGSAIVTGLASTNFLFVGMSISGTGIPASTTVASVDSASQITMSANATSSATSNITFAPYGVGNGTSTFTVPDLRGRAAMGAGAGASLTERFLGTAVGSETHTLTEAQMPAHTHEYELPNDDSDNVQLGGSGSRKLHAEATTDSGSTGGGAAHNNMQPSLGVQWRIKY